VVSWFAEELEVACYISVCDIRSKQGAVIVFGKFLSRNRTNLNEPPVSAGIRGSVLDFVNTIRVVVSHVDMHRSMSLNRLPCAKIKVVPID
jgi:hypothetical protein